jgi:hypothetical protein
MAGMMAFHMNAVSPQLARADIKNFAVVSDINGVSVGTVVSAKFVWSIFLHHFPLAGFKN